MKSEKVEGPYAAIRFTLVVKFYFNLNTMQVLNKFFWKNGTGNCVEGVVNGRTGSGPVRSKLCEISYNTFEIAS